MNKAMLQQQRQKLKDEATALLGTELTDETRAKVDEITGRLEALNGDIARFEKLESIARTEQGKPIEGERRKVDEFSVFGLKPEQRMADYVKATQGIDCENLSLGRAIRGVVVGRWDGAEDERRVMATTSGTTGGFMVPDALSATITDLARNQAVLVQAGVTTIPMATQSATFVRVLSDPDGDFRTEGATITEADGTFGAVTAHAYNFGVLVRVNNELIADAPNFAATIDRQIAASVALKMDYIGLYGTGAGQPQGIRGLDDVCEVSMGDNGAAVASYDDFLDLIQEVEEANGAPTTMIWAPRTKTKAAKLVTGITSDKTKLVPPEAFQALRKITSNQVRKDETQGSSNVASTAFLGGFENTAFAIRQGMTIEASREAENAFVKNQTLIRCIVRFDVVHFRPSHLGRLVGIL